MPPGLSADCDEPPSQESLPGPGLTASMGRVGGPSGGAEWSPSWTGLFRFLSIPRDFPGAHFLPRMPHPCHWMSEGQGHLLRSAQKEKKNRSSLTSKTPD